MCTSNQIVCLKINSSNFTICQTQQINNAKFKLQGIDACNIDPIRTSLSACRPNRKSLFLIPLRINRNSRLKQTDTYMYLQSILGVVWFGLVFFSVLIYFNQTVPSRFSLKAKPPTREWGIRQGPTGSKRGQSLGLTAPSVSFPFYFFIVFG